MRAKFRRLEEEPTQEEIEEHNIDHSKFRSWCPHCVKGKAKCYPHLMNRNKQQREVPKVSIDYAFVDDSKDKRDEEKGMPIIIMKDTETGMKFARVVPKKGVEPYAVSRVAADIKNLGYRKIIFKSDQEPSIVALKQAVKGALDIKVITEESPVADHQSNGEIENTIDIVRGQFKAMKDGLDTRYSTRIHGNHMSVPWLMAHAGATLNRRRVNTEGKTAFRKWKGKDFERKVAEFGENVWYLKAGSAGKEKFDSRWEEGVWLGISDESGESLIGTKNGALKAKDFRRKTLAAERWNKENFDEIQGTPWEPIPGREGNYNIASRITLPDAGPVTAPARGRETEEPLTRRFKILKEHLLKFGYMQGCLGCKNAREGKPAQSHKEECRQRI